MKFNGVTVFVAFWLLLSIMPLLSLSYCMHECCGSHFITTKSHHCCHHAAASLEASHGCQGKVVALSLEQAPLPSARQLLSFEATGAMVATSVSTFSFDFLRGVLAPTCRGAPASAHTYRNAPLLM